MSGKKGRKPRVLQRILNQMLNEGYLTPDLILGLRDWDEGLKKRRFSATAHTKEEAIERTRALMRGLPHPEQLAERWVSSHSIDPHSEAGLRARLSDEMAYCLRKRGVLLPTGKTRTDLPKVIEEVAYELNPGLKEEVRKELERATTIEGQAPTIIEGSSSRIA